MSQNFTVETLDEDRFARATRITLGEKMIQTPSFCTLVQRNDELDAIDRIAAVLWPQLRQ